MSEVKTRFPVAHIPSRFPVAKGAKVDEWPKTIEEMVSIKHTQEEAKYQNSPKGKNKCLNCSKFDGPNSCFGIEGIVSLNGWCKFFEEIKAIGFPILEKLS